VSPAKAALPRRWIGVTTYRREREGRERFSLPAAYVDGVRSAGGLPILLAPGDPAPDLLLDRLDGLVLSGGGDLEPSRPGLDQHAAVYGTCGERDAFEIALARGALERGLPVLAICRGLQLLNVALGGSLHAHLPDVVGETVPHRTSQLEPTAHPVHIAADSRLAELLGTTALPRVPSWHHQAIDRPGEGLLPVAWAEDGVIEAVAVRGAPQVIAVQWHPELDPSPGGPGQRLFRSLLDGSR
jgi:putative glutamine amidotransferase